MLIVLFDVIYVIQLCGVYSIRESNNQNRIIKVTVMKGHQKWIISLNNNCHRPRSLVLVG